MRVHLSAMTLALMTGPALAGETTDYSYDAQGRVTQVERSGTVNNNVDSSYAYDDADNRTNKTTTGATG